MELIEGNYYSPHDLQTFMEVSESTWSHRRNELLSNLSLYYDYEVEYEGRKTTFHILKKLGDYQGIPNKRDASKRNNTYRSKIVEVIKADNVQTASNVARIIKDDSEIRELNHKFGTVQDIPGCGCGRCLGNTKMTVELTDGFSKKYGVGWIWNIIATFRCQKIRFKRFMSFSMPRERLPLQLS